jgi:alpha/beta superfamily hydrolase
MLYTVSSLVGEMCSIEKVTFISKDDKQLKISGTLWIPEMHKSELVCVMVHPWGILGGSAANVEPFAEILAAKYGVASLTFDLRGVGNSEGSSTYRCKNEINDVLGACAFIRSKINKPV